MRTSLLLSAIILAAATMPACAVDDPMATTYGNTLVIVDSDGVESRIHYNADRSFTGKVPSADYSYKGTWSIDATGHVCRKYSRTIPGVPNPDCDEVAVVSHAVGDSWSAVTRGMSYKISLKAGQL